MTAQLLAFVFRNRNVEPERLRVVLAVDLEDAFGIMAGEDSDRLTIEEDADFDEDLVADWRSNFDLVSGDVRLERGIIVDSEAVRS